MGKYLVRGRFYVDVYSMVSADSKKEALNKVKGSKIKKGLKKNHWAKDEQDIQEVR